VDEEPPQTPLPRRRRKRLVAPALLLLFILALALLWALRLPIAADYLRREFDRRGVDATYEIKQIEFGRQRVENLVIGDPKNPDLTARSVELELSWGFRRPRITLITARGVRLRGRLVNGRVSLGQVDKLLPPPTGAPFQFPDQNIDVADASLRLDTPAGRIGIALAGKGNLADGFRGEMAAMSHGLYVGTCRLDRPRAYWKVGIDVLRPTLIGPLTAASIACGDRLALNAPRIELAGRLGPALRTWRGNAQVRANGARLGPNRMNLLAANLTYEGDAAATKGAVEFASAGARLGGYSAERTRLDGRYSVSIKTGDVSLLGEAGARSVSAERPLRSLADALASAGGTPIERVADSISDALRRASRAIDLAGSLRLVSSKGSGGVRIERVLAVSRSGARLALEGGDGITYSWPAGAARIDGNVALSGGGFPTARFALNQPRMGGPINGVGRIAPITVGGSRLALGDVRFSAAPGGATRLDTVATIDGPFDDGDVRGLVMPLSGSIDGRGGFVFGEDCVAARFQSLRTGGLRLGPTSLPLCPTGRALVWKAPGGGVQGGAAIRAPRFAGTLGNSPISLASSRVVFGLDGPNFTASDVAVAVGREGAVHRLTLGAFSGGFGRPGAGGVYSGMSGRLANVPLLLSEGSGRWSVKDGEVFLDGRMRVDDAVEPARFYPLVSEDFRLSLIDNQISATGWLNDLETGTRIVQADISHGLRTGQGRATLDVPGIRFEKGGYQPEQLTRLTTGVVALVDGLVRGRGEISWDGQGTASSGTFSAVDTDFAAAFGPVEGFNSTVHFTDLLGLSSAPSQLAEIDVIRTGIDVLDGRIRYQLLPGLRVKVEGGRWPFAGGELMLEETILDFSKPSAKQLTFHVVGMDIALFVQKMEFSNISATGTFDGTIPMVFDERGGRIVGGSLVARDPGGTLSYIGELTDKELGTYGKLAFDALKSLRYSKLTIGLNGDLAGEFVADIELDGVARDPAATVVRTGGGIRGMIAGRALRELRKIPFEFNITVKGPFRTLIATMRSFEDPTLLIQSVLPEKLRAPDAPTTQPENKTVQPQESESVR
jgi:hypothetical protein